MQTTAISEHLLLEDTLKVTDRLLSAGDRLANFNFALAALGEAVSAARVYIFENIDDGLWGFLGFENPRSDGQLSVTEHLILKSAATNIASAIAWWQTEAKLGVLNSHTFCETRVSKVSDRYGPCEKANREVSYNICYDGLTKVPSRALFIEVLNR